MGRAELDRRWWKLEGDELAGEVCSIAKAMEDEQTVRRRRYLDSLCRYEGKLLGSLSPDAYTLKAEYEELTYALSRTMCDSVQADIAGRQNPKPQFLTSGSDWKVGRRAKKLDRFVEATLHQPQGRYTNAWELAADVFLDCTVWGLGAIKVLGESNRVCLERTFPFELYWDPMEARYGTPLNLLQIRYADKDKLIETYAADDEELAARIDAAQEEFDDRMVETQGWAALRRMARSLKVREIWRLPISPEKPGKYAVVINGVTLFEDDWDRDEFPFIFMRWSNERMGFDGKGLVEENRVMEDRINGVVDQMAERVEVSSGRRVYYTEGSIDEKKLEANDAEVFIPVQAGFDLPREENGVPFTAPEFQWLQYNVDRSFDFRGVSQMSATARKEAGVTAGIAIRTLQDLATKRFAIKAKVYENAFVALGKQIVRTVRDIAKEDPKFMVRWPGRAFLEDIAWKDVNLEQDQYDVTLSPASSLQNDAAGRLSTAQELFASGLMSPLAFKRVIISLNVEHEITRDTAESDYLDKLIDIYLDADEEIWGAGDYESPDGYIVDKPGAMLQFGAAYFQARADGAPEFNLDLLRRYISELDGLIKRAEQAMQAALGAGAPSLATQAPTPMGPIPAGAGAPPISPAPPMAPPGMPMN